MVYSPVLITGYGSVSALGACEAQVRASYSSAASAVVLQEIAGRETYIAPLHSTGEEELGALLAHKPHYRDLDRCTLLAIVAARKAFRLSSWQHEGAHCGVTFGSSRGATSSFEHFHRSYLEHPRGQVSPRSSPTTTLGNISSWVAQDLELAGAAFSHSSTCSSAAHSIANAVAWIRAGMADCFLAGGSEAALTGFTVAQMQTLGIYSDSIEQGYACRPCARNPRNTFVLGEGAACFALEQEDRARAGGRFEKALARVDAIGLAMEELTSPTSISNEADCLAHAMRSALAAADTHDIDALILHAPGTLRGDEAELLAVRSVFGENPPLLLSNKCFLGHTLGASGALSLEYALLLLKGLPPSLPDYARRFDSKIPRRISKVMVNSAGFGGNAASLIVSAMN